MLDHRFVHGIFPFETSNPGPGSLIYSVSFPESLHSNDGLALWQDFCTVVFKFTIYVWDS